MTATASSPASTEQAGATEQAGGEPVPPRGGARRGLVPLGVAAAGLSLIGLGQALPNRTAMEDDLTTRSAAALSAAGFPDAEVTFAGRDGSIVLPSGVSAAAVDRAVAVVRRQEGVRTVRAERAATGTVPADAPADTPLPTVNLAAGAGRVTLGGTVASDASRTALVAEAAKVFGPGAVDDRLTVDPAVAETGVAALSGVLAALDDPDANVTVELAGGVVTLTGAVPTEAARAALAAAAGRAVDTPAAVRDQVTVAAPTRTPEQVTEELSALPKITFGSDSAALTPGGESALDRAAEILAAAPAVRLRVAGYTDSDGPADYNLRLSRARAAAVVAALRERGVAADRMTATGFGETHPLVPNTSAANKASNRRVVLRAED